ncbi:hypothetical protein H310_07633 [Aphanomyces invadans]|uniref:Uncharacterized protein n=1 Tax=Aphanomyces invadans TaxID=157072 RepID=A0A024U2W2_9STRA|nr:hypothetical protein H310_07633 [Aphanomyces invadans]ETW00242.1 hypothetical protein H310_07633 [Aphanomyces invadans]|eukprot:XP_008871267.1 hypothetical protein H310_07633 [Aphanomyces invadans]
MGYSSPTPPRPSWLTPITLNNDSSARASRRVLNGMKCRRERGDRETLDGLTSLQDATGRSVSGWNDKGRHGLRDGKLCARVVVGTTVLHERAQRAVALVKTAAHLRASWSPSLPRHSNTKRCMWFRESTNCMRTHGESSVLSITNECTHFKSSRSTGFDRFASKYTTRWLSSNTPIKNASPPCLVESPMELRNPAVRPDMRHGTGAQDHRTSAVNKLVEALSLQYTTLGLPGLRNTGWRASWHARGAATWRGPVIWPRNLYFFQSVTPTIVTTTVVCFMATPGTKNDT